MYEESVQTRPEAKKREGGGKNRWGYDGNPQRPNIAKISILDGVYLLKQKAEIRGLRQIWTLYTPICAFCPPFIMYIIVLFPLPTREG